MVNGTFNSPTHAHGSLLMKPY